jgi:hypothetical protein
MNEVSPTTTGIIIKKKKEGRKLYAVQAVDEGTK